MYHEANPIKIKTRIRMPSTGMESSKDSKSACGLNGKTYRKKTSVFLNYYFAMRHLITVRDGRVI